MERRTFMGPIFEGDGWFCVIAIIVSELLADIPWLSDQLRLPGIVMISLIFALFYGPEPKRISKKVFAGGSSGPYGCFAAWRAGREFYWKRYLNRSAGKIDLNEKICGHIKKNVPWHILAPRAVACDSLHLRASAHLWHVSAFSCNRKFRGISCYMKKAPSHEDAFISFPYLVKGGLSSLNETGS